MNPEQVSKSQFKARALEYFRQVEASGEKVIVTDKGQPVIEVRRYQNDSRSPLERLQGSVLELQRPTDPVGDEDWEAVV
ncbi:MAG: type II toxin-antitoxin system Phd/YefM family antitoxin [Pseudohongiella sp.]|nr:type II toxin-antitoxin system Phd/YefM family antitoxin [Pseudohongiella sp.]MDO9518908.1 type II toxin-antitoxin system Phd/YefM family antitoxin [Pseudohongiella sp.]MDP2126430.1 type II toxin-antitoxin system Phd/YefM family antitoxin [Pseudohongiella sp.]